MGPLVGATELSKALIEAGNNLLKPHSSTDAILSLLDETESLLSTVEQDPTASLQNALLPSMKALVSAHLLRNPDSDVRVFVVSCLTEIMRITAPEAPYNDDQMKEIFQVTIEAFGKLADASCRSYRKAEVVLETVSKVRSSLVMLDLECDDLILEMFRQFLKVISPDHPQLVLLSMETVMITVIDESEEVSMDLLEILLTAVKKESQDVSPTSSRLVERVLSSCACKLQPCIMEALKLKGTSLDIYSPVVLSICQSESATTEAHNIFNAKESETDKNLSEKQVLSSDSLEDKLDMGLSRKGNRSKRTARGGTCGTNGDNKARTGNDLKPLPKQEQSLSTDAETESGSTKKRGRKPNSLMNPEEGYSFKTSSSNKMQGKELGGSSPRKLSLPTKVGQINQSVVISLSSSGKSRTPRKRSRTKMEETSKDVGSIATPPSKKQIVQKDNSEEDFMESNLEKPEDDIKTAKSSKKERARDGLVKTSPKKPLGEAKMAKTSGKVSVHSDTKKKKTESASLEMPIPLSSKNKEKDRHATAPSLRKDEQTPKSHPKRKRTAREEVDPNTNELAEDLVGKRVNVWWPLDKKFYEGLIDSYCSRTKMHRVSYSDGDTEELNLKKERFEIIQDASEDKEFDLPECIPLSEIIRMQKVKKRKSVSVNVEPRSSPEVRSSVRTTLKKDSVTDFTKQAKRTKGADKAVSNEPESRDGKYLKTLKELNSEPGQTKSRTGKTQKVMHGESEKDCEGKKDPDIKGEDSLKFGKSDAEPDCVGEHQELPENQNAETKTDGEEQKSAKEPNAEPETEGKDGNSLKESIAEPKTEGEDQDAATSEPKTDEKGHKVAKETNAEHETDEKVQRSLKETNVEPKTEGEEREAVEEPEAEPETKVEEKESAKEQTAETKRIEKEDDTSEAKGQEIDKEINKSMPETGKVENEAEDDERVVTKELKEESAKVEVGTMSGSD